MTTSYTLVDTLLRVVSRLRSEGVSIGTSEIVDALRIAENLALLEGREPGIDDLYVAARAVIAHNDRELVLLEHAWREVNSQWSLQKIVNAVEDDLRKLGVRWGARIQSKRRLLNGPGAEERREAYSRLRLLGLIVRTPRGDMVVDRATGLKRLKSITRKYGDPWSALADSAARMISRGRIEWFVLYAAPIDEEKLLSIDVDRVASAGLQALNEGNRGLARKLASLVARRLERGETPRDAWNAFRLLRKLGMMSPSSLASLLRSDPRVADEMLRSKSDKDMLAEALRLLDTRSLRPVLKRVARDPRGLDIAAGLIGDVDLEAWGEVRFSRIPRDWREAAIAAVSALARAEENLLAAAGGSEANLYMAFNELRRLEKLDLGDAPGWVREFIERYRERVEKLKAVVEGSGDVFLRLQGIVRTMDPVEALLYLKTVYQEGDEHLKRVALRLAELIWRRLEARARGPRVYEEKKILDKRGHIDVRRTLYNLVSLREEPIVARRRREKRLLALVLDTSGSMSKYTVWALLAASSFSAIVSRIPLFSRNVSIVRNAWRLSRRRLIELLFKTRFEGYTNISLALRETAKLYNAPHRMIIVTDLCQTVEDEKPSETTTRLARQGWKLYYVLPPRHCVEEKTDISTYAEVMVVSRPEEIPRALHRIRA